MTLMVASALMAWGTLAAVPAARALDCTITGTERADRIVGTPGPDVICGLAGDDTINGGGGDDVIYGGLGADKLIGGAGNDQLLGEGGRDQLDGGVGNDTLAGGSENDIVTGGAGNDGLDGGGGVDRLNGGNGVNTCTWEQREARSTTCVYDMSPPTITAVAFSATEVDISDGAQIVAVDITVTDDRDGVGSVFPGNFMYSSSEFVSAESIGLVSGDAMMGTYRATYRFPSNLRPADYTFIGITVGDRSQNFITLNYDALEAQGWQSAVRVISDVPYESEPPVISDVRISRAEISRSSVDRSVTIDVDVSDSGVGIPEGAVFLTYFKRDDFSAYDYIPAGVRISGDNAKATYRFVFTFRSDASVGEWVLGGVWVVDANRNSIYLLDGDLRERGFDYRIVVIR